MNEDSVISIFNKHFNDFSDLAFKRLQKNDQFKKEEQLYHYTSLDSFQKIIEGKSLQATSIYMMNDPNELIYGYEQLVRWFPPNIQNSISQNERYKSIYGYPAFVFCLTELEDDMYYWDKYGDKHKGIRIGFTPKAIKKYWENIQNIDVVLVPVIYQRQDALLMGDYSEDFKIFKTSFIEDIIKYNNEKELSDIEKSNLAYCLALMASMIKREEWKIEKEWRVVCITGGLVEDHIIGRFINGRPVAKLQNSTEDTYKLFTQAGHDGYASKDIIKIGSHVENKDYIEYIIKLLLKENTKTNYYNDVITQSKIQTR